MPWSKVECFRSALGLPTDVQAGQLGRADIPAWTQALGAFYPDLAIAEEKDLLQAQIYEQQAALRAEPDTDERALYVLLLRSADQLIGGIVVEYDEVEQTVVGRMSVVAPSWRGRGLGRALLRAQEALGQGIGAHSEWGLVELNNHAQRQLLESEGWWLCGIAPESDQKTFPAGAQLYVPEALYIKPLRPAQELTWPQPDALTAEVAALFELLRLPGSPLPETGQPLQAAPRGGLPQLSPEAQRRIAQGPAGMWPAGEIIIEHLQLPAGLVVRQQARRDIQFLVEHLGRWLPELPLSTHRALLTPSFYEQNVALAGEAQPLVERPYYGFVMEREGEIAGVAYLSVDALGVTLVAEFGAVNPRYQKQGLMNLMMPLAVLMGQALAVETLLCWVTLRHPGAQRLAQRSGWQLWGIVPGAEIYSRLGGHQQRGFEALYGVSLIPPEQAQWPAADQLPPVLGALMQFVRGQSRR